MLAPPLQGYRLVDRFKAPQVCVCPSRMRLTDEAGNEFELRILGYQFPKERRDWHDANWLNVEIQVKGPRGSWRASAPVLLTEDVERLAYWLKKAEKGPYSSDEIDFLEPALAFRLTEQTSQDAVLRIYFWLELLPPGVNIKETDREHVWVELKLSRQTLSRASDTLSAELSNFPRRNPDRPKRATLKEIVFSKHAAKLLEPRRRP